MFPPKRYITSAMLITDHWFRLVIANADRRRERGARGRELSPFFYLSEVEHKDVDSIVGITSLCVRHLYICPFTSIHLIYRSSHLA